MDSRTGFIIRALCQVALVLGWMTIGSGLEAESLKGTVVSDHSGEGSHASGEIRLWTGSRIYQLWYGEPLERQFKTELCWALGAIWSVDINLLPDSTYNIIRVTCDGQVDQDAYGPWVVVRDYLEKVGSGSTSASTLFSARWRVSEESRKYEAMVRELDTSDYGRVGRPGRCIDIVQVERPGRTEALTSADCYLRLGGKPIHLGFRVLRNVKEGRWEIDEVTIDPPVRGGP